MAQGGGCQTVRGRAVARFGRGSVGRTRKTCLQQTAMFHDTAQDIESDIAGGVRRRSRHGAFAP
jgi:hypothetical protein